MSEASSHEPCAPLARLGRLAHLDPAAVAAVAEACSTPRHVGANRYVSSEASRRPLLVVSGWCARVRQVMTQRRVFIDLVLPGELVGPVDSATCALMALTDAAVTTAPSVTASPALSRAYARSLQLRESYIMAHISRLAALDAYQRIHDFIAEVFERQLMVSEPLGGAIDFPLSQKQLGDHLGLTSVHVNRTVNRIRSTKELSWAGKRLSIPPGSGIERYARENIARLRSFEDDVNRRAFVQ